MRDGFDCVCAFYGGNCTNYTIGKTGRVIYMYVANFVTTGSVGERCFGHICVGARTSLALSLLHVQICNNHHT